MNNISPEAPSDPCHAEEECDDADAGRPAAEPRQRTQRRVLCGYFSREKNSLQPICAAPFQGAAAAAGLNAASYSHTPPSLHQPRSRTLTEMGLMSWK